MTRIPAQTNGHAKKSDNIDLSKNENVLIREELLDICKNAINDELLSQVIIWIWPSVKSRSEVDVGC